MFFKIIEFQKQLLAGFLIKLVGGAPMRKFISAWSVPIEMRAE